jgi:ubiquinone/menaquinone biosynthesis C-methylase UbiE
MRPVVDLKKIEDATAIMLANGQYILQAHRFDRTDLGHLRKLLEFAQIPYGSRVVDMGSGTGAVASTWSDLRPDLSFALVNISQMQLDSMPKFCVQHCCDMEQVPEADSSFDVAICCFAIGHTDIEASMTEMKRLVRPGGLIFVYDMIREFGDNTNLLELGYQVFDVSFWTKIQDDIGLELLRFSSPVDYDWFCESDLSNEYSKYFGGVSPALWLWKVRD